MVLWVKPEGGAFEDVGAGIAGVARGEAFGLEKEGQYFDLDNWDGGRSSVRYLEEVSAAAGAAAQLLPVEESSEYDHGKHHQRQHDRPKLGGN